VLKGFNLRIKYAGKIKRSGRQDRLAIVKETGRWFTYIPIEVDSRSPKSNPRGYIMGRLDRVRQRDPGGRGCLHRYGPQQPVLHSYDHQGYCADQG